MNKGHWGCVTCGDEYPEDASWCSKCITYKNFGWLNSENGFEDCTEQCCAEVVDNG